MMSLLYHHLGRLLLFTVMAINSLLGTVGFLDTGIHGAAGGNRHATVY